MNSVNNCLPRVLHIFASVDTGGAEKRTLELLEYLGGKGGVHAIVTLSGRRGTLLGRFEAAGVEVYPCSIKSPNFVSKFWKILRNFKPNVVHAHVAEFSAVPLLIAKCFGIRQRIAHFRSDGTRPTTLSALFRRRLLTAMISCSATRIIGVAPGTLTNAYRNEWNSDKRAIVIANGLNLPLIRESKTKFLLPESDQQNLRIVHVGRSAAVKNRERAIRIIAEVNALTPADLIFVGRDNRAEREVWINSAKELGVEDRVYFLGDRPDVIPILKNSDVLLQTSFYEGLPGVLLEALAVGLPCVATRLPGSEFILDEVGGPALLDLDQSDSEWAQTIIGQSVDSCRFNPGLDQSRLSGTIFDLDVSAESMRAVWEEQIK